MKIYTFRQKGPLKLDLGCGPNKHKGYIGLDEVKMPGVDIIADLNSRLPFKDNTFDEVMARCVLEHVDDIFFTVEEIHRILKPGGKLEIYVPYWNSYFTYADLQHKRGYVENSFDCFTEDGKREYSNLNYYTKARFRMEKAQVEGGRLLSILKLLRLDRFATRYFNNVASALHFEMIAIKKK